MKKIEVQEGNLDMLKGSLYFAGASLASGMVILILEAHDYFGLLKGIVAGAFGISIFIIGRKLEPVKDKEKVK